MSAYTAILSARCRTYLQYRGAALAGFGTQLFWGLMRVMIFEAFYRSTRAPQPMTLEQVVVYIWLGQAMLGMLPWNLERDIQQMVRTGTVVYELLKPVDLYWLWFYRALAMRSIPTLMRAVPMFVAAGIFFRLTPPPTVASGIAWVISMIGALLLSSAISTLLNISMLWTISGEGIARLMMTFSMIFSGSVVPLPFFPSWAQRALDFMPFRGIVDLPFRIYTGHIPPAEIGWVFLHQMLWSLAFIAVGRMALARGTRRLVVQGG